jgi:ribosomal protein S18 acetylase RimI-like enzyme
LVLIRDATAAELEHAGDIRVAAYQAGGFLSADSEYAPRLRSLGADGTGHVLVAVGADGMVMGTIMLSVWPDGGELLAGPGEAEIRALAVLPEAQGSGIGRQLLSALIQRAAEAGVRHLMLSTEPEMLAAHHLYQQAGFTRLPERDWSPEPGVSLLVYSLDLTTLRDSVPDARAGCSPGG